jgi:hypothetical protein
MHGRTGLAGSDDRRSQILIETSQKIPVAAQSVDSAYARRSRALWWFQRLVISIFGQSKNSLAAAGIATLAAASSAQAAIVTVVVYESFMSTTPATEYDLNGDGNPDIIVAISETSASAAEVRTAFRPDTKSVIRTGLQSELLSFGDPNSTGGDGAAPNSLLVRYDGGEPSSAISAGLLFSRPDRSGYVSITFPSAGGPVFNGWVEFSAAGTTKGDMVLTFEGYGYENSGASITMGEAALAPVPLPAAGLLMAGGTATLGAVGHNRRRRKKG